MITISVLVNPRYCFADIQDYCLEPLTTVQPTIYNGKRNYLISLELPKDQSLLKKITIERELND